MSAPGARASGWLALACALTSGCAFDLERLRGPREGGADVVTDADLDVPVTDDLADVVAPDVTPPDVVMDVPGEDHVEPPTCNTVPVIDPTPLAARIGPSMVINNSTMLAPSTVNPPTLPPGCSGSYSDAPAPERVFRYTMSSRGGRLYATTDAPACAGVFDTIVYVRSSCELDAGTVLACNDDDNVLASCVCDATACPSLASGVSATDLVPGQTVYVVVDGYRGHAGLFRLVLTENAARNEPPPDALSGLLRADRCGCPDSLDTAVWPVSFPSSADAVTGSSTTLLAQPGDRLSGLHRVSFSSVGGVALETVVARNTLGTTPICRDARATFDLLVNNTVVHSFSLGAEATAGTPVAVALQTFASLHVSTTVDIPIAIRLRSVSPTGCSGGIEFDRASPGTLSLLGHR